ncbi:MAG: DUF3616 domain-containing protein [Desulfobulbaceae bacterium]|nr:MAG: DUF3616 domain-containing protein [Desulfobulbaceae bacterium]
MHNFLNVLLVAAIGCAVHCDGVESHAANALMQRAMTKKFIQIYEPSGILQLADGRLLLVEDERTDPFSLCRLEEEDGQLVIGPPVYCRGAGIADDLEGIAHGPDDWLYAITSHSRTESGTAESGRQKLLRFKVDEEGRIRQYQEYNDLLMVILTALKGLDADLDSLNIEGLGTSRDGKQLLIGLREPVVEGEALILSLENPEGLFERGETPQLKPDIIRLWLQGGGIRSIEYIEKLAGYLIANEIEYEGGKVRAALWFWDGIAGHPACRLEFPSSGKLKNIEGVTLVVTQGRSLLLLVCDDGKRQKGDTAHYQFVEFGQLIEVAARGEDLSGR